MLQDKQYGTVELGRRNCFSLVRSRKYGAWDGPRMVKLVDIFSKVGVHFLQLAAESQIYLSVAGIFVGETLPYLLRLRSLLFDEPWYGPKECDIYPIELPPPPSSAAPVCSVGHLNQSHLKGSKLSLRTNWLEYLWAGSCNLFYLHHLDRRRRVCKSLL